MKEKKESLFITITFSIIASIMLLLVVLMILHQINQIKFNEKAQEICSKKGYEWTRTNEVYYYNMDFKCCTIKNYEETCTKTLKLIKKDVYGEVK